MQTFKYQTNIKCSGCKEKVKSQLDAVKEIDDWEVNLESIEKTLTVKAHPGSEDKIIQSVQSAGFLINKINS